MTRWLKEPFLHFLVGGAVLFGAHAWLNPANPESGSPARQVRIGRQEIRWLSDTWVRQWHREPTPAELRVLVASLLKEELLSREARELRLDEHDTIVRRRLAQKLEFMLQDTARTPEPTEEDLRRLYEASPEAYRTDPRVSFEHVYFSPARRKDAAKDAAEALVTLASVRGASAESMGDPLLLEAEFRNVDRQAVVSAFGPAFAGAVFTLPPGAWRGPLESGVGIHLVRVASTDPGRRRPFTDVRAQLSERWREEQQRETQARFLKQLMAKYQVAVDEDVRSVVGQLPESLVTQ